MCIHTGLAFFRWHLLLLLCIHSSWPLVGGKNAGVGFNRHCVSLLSHSLTCHRHSSFLLCWILAGCEVACDSYPQRVGNSSSPTYGLHISRGRRPTNEDRVSANTCLNGCGPTRCRPVCSCAHGSRAIVQRLSLLNLLLLVILGTLAWLAPEHV